jgi:hypothetical protein
VIFRNAVNQTPHLNNAWMAGLQALRPQDRPQDRPHVNPSDPRQLRGSVDVDTALQNQQPNANRWDFGIAYRHANRQDDCVYWVEVHTGNNKAVNVVLAKLNWLRNWLAGDGKLLNQFERDFIWVSSGATSFTLTAPQLKRFALLGLQHKGKVLRIPSLRP